MPNSSRRIFAVTLGDDTLASSRVRSAMALASLQTRGWRIGRTTAASRYWPISLVMSLIFRKPSLTLLQKVVPPIWLGNVVASLSSRLVFECDDAIHLGYEASSEDSQRTTRRLRSFLPHCDCVIVSNELLAKDLIQLGARDPIVFPGPAPALMTKGVHDRRGVLWLGSPSTFDNVLSIVYPAFDLLPATLELAVVGATRNASGGQISEYVWSQKCQELALASARVGVAPQAQDDWSLRKAFYKVLEYLAAGVVPVVPAHAAVRTLLGDELEIVAVVAEDDTPAAWATAINEALCVTVDMEWTAARDAIFARWSVDHMGRVMLG